MKKISVIMPCYNAEQLIDETIENLLQQSMDLSDMEFIFVNDASTDSTLEHLCDWEQRYPDSVLVVHCEQNGRQGMARNIGISYATGEYLAFMDQDDRIDRQMYETMYLAATRSQADLVIAGSKKCTLNEYKNLQQAGEKIEDGQFEHRFLQSIEIIENEKSRNRFLQQDDNIAIWNKLYKRNLILDNRIEFLPGMIYDDIYFSGLIKQYAGRIVRLNQVFYYHIIGERNASYGQRDKNLAFGYIEAWLELIAELQKRGKYVPYQEFYKQEFVLSYLAFIHSYCKQFGYLEISLWNRLRDCIFKLMPDLLDCPYVKMKGKNSMTEFLKKSLKKRVDETYILGLVKLLEQELRG